MHKRNAAWPLAVGVIAVGGLAALGWNTFSGSPVKAADPADIAANGPTAVKVAPPAAGAIELQNAFQNVAEAVRPAVVHITSRKTISAPEGPMGLFGQLGPEGSGRFQMPPRQARGNGSGFIVRADGYIMTNDHVVGGADQVTVTLDDGREFTGKVIRDQRSDLALVKVEASGLPVLSFADSNNIKVGQWAIAYGSPLGLSDTMTAGIVSALGRETEIGAREEARFYPNLIQTDASINPGNSGGPLLDIYGNVVGVNVAIASPTGTSVGIGFAIPANSAKFVMEQLITTGRVTRGFLGFAPESMNVVEKQRYGVQNGVLVMSVEEGTPAAKAGLQVEDVVTQVDGQPVDNEAALRELIARTAPGTKMTLTVRRDGKDLTLNSTVAEAPGAQVAAAPAAPAAAPRQQGKLGVGVADITPEIARQLNMDANAKGAVVGEVTPGSPAQEAGIRPGDILLRVNGKQINQSSDVAGAVQSLKPGDEASLVIRRDKSNILARVNIR
jgi:serine protease Do